MSRIVCPPLEPRGVRTADPWKAEGLSYSQQYDELFAGPMDRRVPLPKPSTAAQAREPAARRIPFSNVWATSKLSNFNFGRLFHYDIELRAAMVVLHLACLAAPFTFSWRNLALAVGLTAVIGCLGICVSFHRQLTHRSFTTHKWLEYLLAYIGTMAMEHSPIIWVQHHRFHHLQSDTAMDPHSSYEGFWWSHMGWLMHTPELHARTGDDRIVKDLTDQAFYRFMEDTWPLHVNWQFFALYWWGGWPAFVWGGAVRQVLTWHITFAVNSVCHVWGSRPYATGDLSTNNAWMAIPTFGEAWHNNHHAFAYSARHGLEWWQVDLSWCVIRTLQLLGLAWDVRLPSEEAKRKMRARAAANGVAATAANGTAAGAANGAAAVAANGAAAGAANGAAAGAEDAIRDKEE